MEKGDREKGRQAGSWIVREKSRTDWVGTEEVRRKGKPTSPVLSVWKTEPYYFAFQSSLGSLLRQVV